MVYVIFDIDGTLADVEHRRHHVAARDWGAFYGAMAADPVIGPVAALNSMVAERATVYLCSGRPEDYRETTEAWLDNAGVRRDALLMRPSGDFRSDVIVKREMLAELRSRHNGDDPLFVIDDRQTVVDMWRAEGIVCLQAAPGDFDKPKASECGMLHVLVGPSHAGKSTWARAQWGDGPWMVSSDQIREELCGDAADQSRNAAVFAAVHAVAGARVASGLDAVVDATNIRTKDRLAVVDAAPVTARVVYHVFDRPLDDKLASLRPGFPADVVRRHDQTFRSNLKDILAGDGRANVTVEDHR